MIAFRRMAALLPAAALSMGLGGAPQAASLGTTENTQFLPVWIAPRHNIMAVEVPALLNMPPGWSTGDAAVVLAPGGDWPAGLRDRLVAALLDSGAAVLELNAPRQGGDPAAALATDIRDALGTLHLAFGAGLVVAIGRGEAGALAAEAAAAARTPEGRAYAAVALLGPGAPRFWLGEVPEVQAWPARAPLFCSLLGEVLAPGGVSACQASLAVLR